MLACRILRRSSDRVGKATVKAAGDPVFTRGGNIHMFANKERAWEHHTEDRWHGLKRFKEVMHKIMVEKGVRYYILGTLTVMFAAGARLWALQEDLKATHGLLGDKKKAYKSRLTVVFDVDETVVSYGDKAFRMKAGMIPRPHLAELLDYLCTIDAEVVLWSAASDRYTKQVLQVIDPSGQRVSASISRSNDWFTKDHYYEKNAHWLNRDMKDTLIIENRALAVRNCNANALLVEDFIRGEYMDDGQDHPVNDNALRIIKDIVKDLETSGTPVPEYLADAKRRNSNIKEIPCHVAIRQMPEELARGVYYFIGNKFKANRAKDEVSS
jgi:hypothetical protein